MAVANCSLGCPAISARRPFFFEVDLRGGAQQELPALDCQVVVDFAQSGQLSRQTRASRAAGCSLLASRGTGPRSTFEIEKGQTETTRHRRGASTVTTPPATTATKRAIASSVRGESPDCTAEHCSDGRGGRGCKPIFFSVPEIEKICFFQRGPISDFNMSNERPKNPDWLSHW